MRKIITLLILLFFIASLTSCVTFKLEKQLRKLNPTIANWYEVHSILMETKIPKWIDERGGSEKKHFLRLPQEMQLKYMTMFWRIRDEGLWGEYNARVMTANDSFSGEGKSGWRTDRGKVLLLCGFPQHISHSPIIGQTGLATNTEGYLYEIWEYYQRGQLIRYVFKYHAPNTWRREWISLFSMSGQSEFEERCRKRLAPSEEGWDLWGSVLLQWVRANETP